MASKIIKSTDSKVVCLENEPIKLDYGDLNCQSNDHILTIEEREHEVLSNARTEAEIIIENARCEAESIKAAGYKEGLQNAAAEAQLLIERLNADIAQIAEDRLRAAESLEPEVLKLCNEIVEKVIRHEIRTNPRIIIKIIKSCLRRVKDSTEVYIRVSPQEVEEVRNKRDELLSIAEGVRIINISDDRRITPGGCVIESMSGDFDAKVETQLEKVTNKLTETFENEHGCNANSKSE